MTYRNYRTQLHKQLRDYLAYAAVAHELEMEPLLNEITLLRMDINRIDTMTPSEKMAVVKFDVVHVPSIINPKEAKE